MVFWDDDFRTVFRTTGLSTNSLGDFVVFSPLLRIEPTRLSVGQLAGKGKQEIPRNTNAEISGNTFPYDLN